MESIIFLNVKCLYSVSDIYAKASNSKSTPHLCKGSVTAIRENTYAKFLMVENNKVIVAGKSEQ